MAFTTRSIVGQWFLKPEGSDIFPGLDSLAGCPWSCLVGGGTDCLTIEQRKNGPIEEVSISVRRRQQSAEQVIVYKIGTLNFFGPMEPRRMLAFVEDTSSAFDTLSITTLGPKLGQRCSEHFHVDKEGAELKASVEFFVDDHKITFNRYFVSQPPEVASGSRRRQSFSLRSINPILFTNSRSCRGWRFSEFRSVKLLRKITVSIKWSEKLKTMRGNRAPKLPDNSELTNPNMLIMDRYRADPANKDGLVIFLIQVVIGSTNWMVGHRYSEFDALRKMIPANVDMQSSPPFPKKSYGLGSDLEARKLGLETFLTHLLNQGAYDNPNLVLAILSFLEIPEHLQGKKDKEAALMGIPPSPALSTDSAAPSFPLSGPTTSMDDSSIDSSRARTKPRMSILARPFSTGANAHVSNSTNSTSMRASTLSLGGAAIESGTRSSVSASTSPAVATGNDNASSNDEISAARTNSAPVIKKPIISAAITKPAVAATSSAAVDNELSDDRSRTISLYPQDNLFEALRLGRQGLPKRRLLRCDHSVSRLYWDKPPSEGGMSFMTGSKRQLAPPEGMTPDLPSEDKSILLTEVIGVRRGTEEDDSEPGKKGTAVLRRNCKTSDLPLCFSLLLSARTLDIQCLNQADFDLLYNNFAQLVKVLQRDK